MRPWLAAAALLGLASVGFGAFAAHVVTAPWPQTWLRTGSEYAFVHVLAAFVAASLGQRWAQRLFVVGAAIFAGTLWAMALGAPLWLGAITPIGGVAMMIGWALLAGGMLRRQA
jgi:uncharacterized membrane protein YgdD (TMEM256/DUF423 family)